MTTFRPTAVAPVRTLRVPVPQGWRRIQVELDVTPAAPRPGIAEKLLWLGMPNNLELGAFAFVLDGRLFLRSGFGMPMGPGKVKMSMPCVLDGGETQHVSLDLTADGRVDIAIGDVALSASYLGDAPDGDVHAVLTLGGDGSGREAVQEGWAFSGLVVIVDGEVVIDETTEETDMAVLIEQLASHLDAIFAVAGVLVAKIHAKDPATAKALQDLAAALKRER